MQLRTQDMDVICSLFKTCGATNWTSSCQQFQSANLFAFDVKLDLQYIMSSCPVRCCSRLTTNHKSLQMQLSAISSAQRYCATSDNYKIDKMWQCFKVYAQLLTLRVWWTHKTKASCQKASMVKGEMRTKMSFTQTDDVLSVLLLDK
jgi:hypothetical protein